MAGTAVRHRVPTRWSKAVARFRNAQRRNAGRATGNALRKLHEKTSGPSPRRTVAVPVQRPALGGQVTTATPFAPRGSRPRSATGAASRRLPRHSVNALTCKAPEIGVGCGWQSAHRVALLMPFNFPTVISSEAARGVDRGKCGLRSLPGFWARGVGEGSSARHVRPGVPLTGRFQVRPWFDTQGFPLGFGDGLVLDCEPKALCSDSVHS